MFCNCIWGRGGKGRVPEVGSLNHYSLFLCEFSELGCNLLSYLRFKREMYLQQIENVFVQ